MKNWKLDYQYLKTPCLSWLRVIYTVVDVPNRYVKEICHIYSYVFVSLILTKQHFQHSVVKIRHLSVDMGNVGERYIVYYMHVVPPAMLVSFRLVNYEYLYFIKKNWVGTFLKKNYWRIPCHTLSLSKCFSSLKWFRSLKF